MSEPVSALVGQRLDPDPDADAVLAVVLETDVVVLGAEVEGATADVGLVEVGGPLLVVDDVAEAE